MQENTLSYNPDWRYTLTFDPAVVLRSDSADVLQMCFNFSLFASCVVAELKDTVAVSSSSLNSENPYATIKDLPGLPFCPPESSYMEMKSAVPRERAYTEISPPPFNTATLRRGERHFRPPSAMSFTFLQPKKYYNVGTQAAARSCFCCSFLLFNQCDL